MPIQRNSREENKRIKEGKSIEGWSEAKRRQKDTDARWVKKNGKNYFGYKNHISVYVKGKFIRKNNVTVAYVHGSQVFEELLDSANTSKDIWADSAYNSFEIRQGLEEKGYREHLQRKGCRNRKLSRGERRGI